MLELNNIKKSYSMGNEKKQSVLKNLNLKLSNSGFISIIGSSGNGKTTLINIVAGLDGWDSGEVLFNKKKVSDYEKFRREKVGIVFQDSNLIPHLSAVDNVIVSMSDEKTNKREKAIEILEKLGLNDCLNKLPRQMSGGQQQRVAISRVIAKDPDIIICDEPTGNLDEETENKITEIIKELSKKKLVLFVTHNLKLAEKYSDRILKIKNGTVLDDDKDEPVSTSEKNDISKSYKKTSSWLSYKNLKGRYKHTLKYIFLASLIMFVTAMSIILEGEFFKRYTHELFVGKGLKNIFFDIKADDNKDDLIKELNSVNHVDYASYTYFRKLGISSTGGSKFVKQTGFENIEGNDYFKGILTDGRYPEKSDEVLMSSWGAISLLKDLNIGGERLYDQYMTGEFPSSRVYNIIDDKEFVIAEYGRPRIKIVGLVDDDKVYETSQILYYIDGFTSLFKVPLDSWVSGVKLYKDGLYKDTNQEIIKNISENYGIKVNEDYEKKLDAEYDKINSILNLSKMSLYIVLILALISFISIILTSLLERKFEVGLYRAIGYTKNNIIKILALEMITIGIISVFIVFILLMIFAGIMYGGIDYMDSFTEILESFNILKIFTALFSIVVALSLISTYGANKIILKKPVVSNLKDL